MTIFHATSPGQPQKSMDLKYLLAPSRTPFLSFWSRTCSPAKQGGTSNNSKKPGSTWESPLPDWKYETQKPDIRGEDENKTPGVLFRDLVAVCLERRLLIQPLFLLRSHILFIHVLWAFAVTCFLTSQALEAHINDKNIRCVQCTPNRIGLLSILCCSMW